jgi:ubiquinone/menaquinone biosynthesis C-methylase UbiE
MVAQAVSPASRGFADSDAAFDRVAARYDETWTNSAIGRAQRDQVWREIDPLFQRGDHILDIGCGTGEDAAHLAARGVSVDAIDASPAMIEQARGRGGFSAWVLRAEELGRAWPRPTSYDGAISNFGVLNCLADWPAFARDLAVLVRPGGAVAICVIGRFCAWETIYYATRLQFGKAFRRVRGTAGSSLGVRVRYRSVGEFLAPEFELRAWVGIGLFVPPSYVRLPRRMVRLLAALDRVCGNLPLLRGLADHRLLIFVRK